MLLPYLCSRNLRIDRIDIINGPDVRLYLRQCPDNVRKAHFLRVPRKIRYKVASRPAPAQ